MLLKRVLFIFPFQFLFYVFLLIPISLATLLIPLNVSHILIVEFFLTLIFLFFLGIQRVLILSVASFFFRFQEYFIDFEFLKFFVPILVISFFLKVHIGFSIDFQQFASIQVILSNF